MAAVARGEDVDPTTYYMRTHARLETGDERYGWVNNTLFVDQVRVSGQRYSFVYLRCVRGKPWCCERRFQSKNISFRIALTTPIHVGMTIAQSNPLTQFCPSFVAERSICKLEISLRTSLNSVVIFSL